MQDTAGGLEGVVSIPVGSEENVIFNTFITLIYGTLQVSV